MVIFDLGDLEIFKIAAKRLKSGYKFSYNWIGVYG